jgi:hypothetical protein
MNNKIELDNYDFIVHMVNYVQSPLEQDIKKLNIKRSYRI